MRRRKTKRLLLKQKSKSRTLIIYLPFICSFNPLRFSYSVPCVFIMKMNKQIRTSISLIMLVASFMAGPLCAQAQAPSAEKFPYSGEVIQDKINVRAGQSANFEKLAQLKKGENIVVVDRSYSWYKIKLPVYARSFISLDFVNMLSDDVGEITGNRVNVRAGRGINYSVLGQLNKGNLIKVVEKSAGWCRIEPINDSWGWVLAKYIKFKSQKTPPSRIVFAPTKNIYKKKQQQRVKEESLPEPPKKFSVEEMVSATGVIATIGGDKAIGRNIRHKIVVDGQTKYFLQGYRTITDSFLRQQVKIEGKPLPQIKADHPVILITKIQLVL